MNQRIRIAKSITEALASRNQISQWEAFITGILKRLELTPAERARAKYHYELLARQVARKLDVADNDVHILVQGSMRTQTTIAQRGNQKFDLDLVVKLTGSKFQGTDPETFFREFGESLEGLSDAGGEPEPKNRCWRLQYPNEPFYFDITPALPGSALITGTDLRVRDPAKGWTPSNPEEFANWFCTIADLRFAFYLTEDLMKAEARKQVDPLPSEPVAIDDILRRTLQLIKLHRDNYYFGLSPERKAVMPISVILMTLATQAYEQMWTTQRTGFKSPIEVVLEIVDRIPVEAAVQNGKYCVPNPKLYSENFADRWTKDGGERAVEYGVWHNALTADLAALFGEDYNARTEARLRKVFGQAGVDAWKASIPASKPDVLKGLLATLPAQPRNPSAPNPVGSKNTLA